MGQGQGTLGISTSELDLDASGYETDIEQRSEIQANLPIIQVKGIFLAKPVNKAIINVSNSKEILYSEGDIIYSELKLHKLHRDYIELLFRDKTYKYYLDGESAHIDHHVTERTEVYVNLSQTFEDKMVRYVNDQDLNLVAFPNGLDFKGIEKVVDGLFDVKFEVLNPKILSSELLEQAQFQFISGEGLKLNELVPGGSFDKAGLLTNDILKSVNNIPIDTPLNMTAVYQQFESGNQIIIDIMRNNERAQMIYNINR